MKLRTPNIDVVMGVFFAAQKNKRETVWDSKIKRKWIYHGSLEVYTLQKAFQYTSCYANKPCPNISLDIYELTNSVVLVACGYYYYTWKLSHKREIE